MVKLFVVVVSTKNKGVYMKKLMIALLSVATCGVISARHTVGQKPRCEKPRTVIDTCPAESDLVYSCPPGKSLRGKRCEWPKTVVESCPANRETVYSCDEGKTLVGKRCEWDKTVIESCPADTEVVYSCPPGTEMAE
jgi:hypothetical protein